MTGVEKDREKIGCCFVATSVSSGMHNDVEDYIAEAYRRTAERIAAGELEPAPEGSA